MPVAEVKRDFKRVLDAAEKGESTVVLRHGKAVAVIGPAPGTEPWRKWGPPKEPGGLLSLVGTLTGPEGEEFVQDMKQIVADRQKAIDRPPPEFGE